MAFFVRRVGDHADAEDLTQEVFIRLANATDGVRRADAYVFQVAANLIRDRARRLRVRQDYGRSVELEDGAGVDPLDPFRVAMDREHLAILGAEIAGLPEKTRRIFTLYRLEDVDKRTIASSFGLSVRAVEIHIQKAMALLVERLGDAL